MGCGLTNGRDEGITKLLFDDCPEGHGHGKMLGCGMIGPMTPPLTLEPVNDGVCAVRDAQGVLVGNLKRIGPVWKFKALGHTAAGELVPGGGSLTARHNAVFERLDAAEVNARLRVD